MPNDETNAAIIAFGAELARADRLPPVATPRAQAMIDLRALGLECLEGVLIGSATVTIPFATLRAAVTHQERLAYDARSANELTDIQVSAEQAEAKTAHDETRF